MIIEPEGWSECWQWFCCLHLGSWSWLLAWLGRASMVPCWIAWVVGGGLIDRVRCQALGSSRLSVQLTGSWVLMDNRNHLWTILDWIRPRLPNHVSSKVLAVKSMASFRKSSVSLSNLSSILCYDWSSVNTILQNDQVITSMAPSLFGVISNLHFALVL